MSEDTMRVREERDGAVLVLTLDYPARRNALAMPLRAALEEALERAHAESGVRAVVLTGGGEHFCSGGDISRMDVGTAMDGRERMRRTHRLVRLMSDMGLPHFLPARVGVGRARRILLYHEPLTAPEAERIGLVDFVAPRGHALATALEKARFLAEEAPAPIRLTKEMLAEGLDEALEREKNFQGTLFTTEDHKEGRAAFLGKRKPVFRGG